MRGNLVERFGVHLPLSTNFTLLGPGGTRHAAALGLAEQSDALVIVVSEERGSVSLARNGQLQTMDDPQELAGRLEAFSREGTQQQRPSRWVRRFAGPLLTFSAAFVAAVFFWLMFAFQVETVQRVVDQVPVESHQLPQDWVIESMTPQQVRVNVTGSQRAFAAYNWSTLRVALDLSQPSEGVQTVAVGEESMQLPVEISLVQAEPSVVRVTAYKTRTVRLPVEVKTHGELPKEWELVSQTPSLKSVDVKVRESLLPRIKAVPTKSIDLADVASTRTQEVSLVLPEGVWPSEDMPSKVQVAFQLRRIEAAPMK
jgi:YbbR domain-containing protein